MWTLRNTVRRQMTLTRERLGGTSAIIRARIATIYGDCLSFYASVNLSKHSLASDLGVFSYGRSHVRSLTGLVPIARATMTHLTHPARRTPCPREPANNHPRRLIIRETTTKTIPTGRKTARDWPVAATPPRGTPSLRTPQM